MDLEQSAFERTGCIGCQFASKRKRMETLARCLKDKQAYIRTFDWMQSARGIAGKSSWLRRAWMSFAHGWMVIRCRAKKNFGRICDGEKRG